jgi:hypothetical protein
VIGNPSGAEVRLVADRHRRRCLLSRVRSHPDLMVTPAKL